eukprot:scaffold26096_cov31-Tisochrysis_lutea.AAC.6
MRESGENCLSGIWPKTSYLVAMPSAPTHRPLQCHSSNGLPGGRCPLALQLAYSSNNTTTTK